MGAKGEEAPPPGTGLGPAQPNIPEMGAPREGSVGWLPFDLEKWCLMSEISP